jgi:hypothetical protein
MKKGQRINRPGNWYMLMTAVGRLKKASILLNMGRAWSPAGSGSGKIKGSFDK